MRNRVLILAAGGGHTGYAYALAEELYRRTSLSFLVPQGDLLSAKRLGRFGKVGFLPKPREAKTPTRVFAVRFAKAFLASFKQNFRKFDIVVSAGSNFCVPPAIIAKMEGVPIVNIESPVRFVKPSKSAILLEHFSAVTALHWEEQKRLLKGVVVGPVLPKPEFRPHNKGYILVTGGTYGHKLLFNALAESNIRNVVLQTGEVDPAPYVKKHPEWKVITVSESFHELLAGAELVVTHFGLTVLEAVVYNKPVVVVLNPEWTRGAQAEDARYLARKVNGILVSEIKLENLLDAMCKAREREVPELPDGAKNLSNMIIKLCRR